MTTTGTRDRSRARLLTTVSFGCAAVATLMPPTAITLGLAAVVLGVLGFRVLVLVDEMGWIDTGWGE